ncbi:MAG TPA: hypothetical protein VJ874_02900, partial [Candidatus Thermoplasmatota archaeon]|nr:hypothetical protein [Candidatus Thermoplasmatota archaeon]
MPANASTVEDTTSGFVAYQFDGGSHHDAPDTCAAAASAWSVALGTSTDGLLVAPDDVSDVFLVDVPDDQRGERVQVSLSEAADLGSLELTAFVPGCDGTVLDLVNWPTPEPSPPEPAPGERQVAVADASEPWYCYGEHRAFWVELVQGYGPAPTIHVAWTDGSALDVPLSYTHGEAHAVYASDDLLGVTLKGAWVNMPADWSGRFEYVAGPCDAADGGAVYGEPPVAGMGFLAFTPTQAGLYALQVTYREAAGGGPVSIPAPVSVDPEPFMPFEPSEVGQDPSPPRVEPPGPLVMPMSCHMCIGEVEDLV